MITTVQLIREDIALCEYRLSFKLQPAAKTAVDNRLAKLRQQLATEYARLRALSN